MRLLITFPISRILIAIVFGLLLTRPAKGQQIAYVLDISGDWFLNSKSQLREASTLPSGGTITTRAPTERSNCIVVADRSGKIIGRRDCRNPGKCDNPIQLPREQSPGAFRTLFDQGIAILSSGVQKYVPLISMGVDLDEAVVKLEKNRVDLAAACKNLEAGDYFLSFEIIGREGRTSNDKATGPLPFKWNPTHPFPSKLIG